VAAEAISKCGPDRRAENQVRCGNSDFSISKWHVLVAIAKSGAKMGTFEKWGPCSLLPPLFVQKRWPASVILTNIGQVS